MWTIFVGNPKSEKLELSVYPPGIPAILSQNLFTVDQKYKNMAVRKTLLKKLNSVCREHIYQKESDWIFFDLLVTNGRTNYANIKLQIFPSMLKLESFLQLVDMEHMPKKINATFEEALANLMFFNDSDTMAMHLFQDHYPTEQGKAEIDMNEICIYREKEQLDKVESLFRNCKRASSVDISRQNLQVLHFFKFFCELISSLFQLPGLVFQRFKLVFLRFLLNSAGELWYFEGDFVEL